ncbi:type III polyketide synthase [Geobacter sp. DSM 9736]|uniref:type III polyketide synthase n=1 Tax=Geobacter sp. DSM 9736 TaxID=1277350 RepID=UPI000B50BD91|nr:3-oxoacyl-[acyl-carrier-protein] synthase III C-terminal domain-containing protein [Geobacter sp. DSM 9736]SNB45983.1 alkylresorcinol/alkylpyrone synthase [Geobacter sp. DSM 9736]
MGTAKAYIASIAAVAPAFSADQQFVADLIRDRYSAMLTPRSQGLIRATFSHPSIRKRHFALDDPLRVIDESPDERIARFTEKSIELSGEAVASALDRAGLGVADVRGLVVNTCTGYICPGISTYLLERLGLPRSTRVYDMVGSGCGGALPNLQVAESILGTTGGAVVSVAVEICSAVFQMDNSLSLIMSNAIFSDGAAAAVLWERPEGLELVASASRYVPEKRDDIRFVHRQGQLHNQLSLNLPGVVKVAAAEAVGEVLSCRSLTPGDIRHWALHTGGEKIINAVRDEIGIPEERLRATRRILEEYGNMSSPTVWFVLDELLREGVPPGDWCLMAAYGAGLSAHAYLLKKSPVTAGPSNRFLRTYAGI